MINEFNQRANLKQSRVLRNSVLGAFTGTFLLLASPALAGAPERAATAIADVEKGAARLDKRPQPRKRTSPEQLLAAADLHIRTKQYTPAIDKLSKIVELRRQGKASESTDVDAQFLLGKAYFATGELYSARRHFEVVTDHASNPAYARMGGPAASRLVDIALRIQRVDTLPGVLSRVDRMLAQSRNEALTYARAKVLFAMGRFRESREQTSAMQGDSLYAQRAAYLRGTALMKEAQRAVEGTSQASRDSKKPVSNQTVLPDYRSAIAAFEQATVAAADLGKESADSRKVTDLAWLAVARLQYAAGRNNRAAVAYQKIPRSSEFFSRALFELAWTYVRLGDYQRGQRALEALAVLEPGLIDGADAELLRGDLLLRSGRFKDAQTSYEQVREKYDPLRQQVDAYLKANSDPATYYDKLTAAEIETGHELPALAIDWAREEAEEERVFSIVDDVARSRKLVKRSRRLVTLLRASLGSSSRAKVFPEVQRQLEGVVSLLNQLGIARLILARGLDDEASEARGPLRKVRAERQQLMNRLGHLPTNPGNFSVREDQSQKKWNQTSQTLQRLQLEADHLAALVNGLKRVVSEADRHGVVSDAEGLERFRLEIVENEKDLFVYSERISELRRQVEVGRVQTGFGDELFEEDDRVRAAFRRLFTEEVALVRKSRDKAESRYANKIKPLLTRLETIEGRLESMRKILDAEALARGNEMQIVVNNEARSIEVYASKLDTMDQHARLLVGEVARSNFVKVRDRITDVVMRADVGMVQQAWEVREEQRHRVRELLRERAREDRFITDELREVMDDAGKGAEE